MEGEFAQAEQQVEEELNQECPMKATTNLMDTMMSDPDPKFRNSKFLHFIQQVGKGNYEIKDNEVIKHKEEPLQHLADENIGKSASLNHWSKANLNED